jgi:hypothetical protein
LSQKLPTVDEQTGGNVGAGLSKGDEAMRLLRRAVVELVRGASISEAMTNGDKIRFVNAITAASMFKSPARAAGVLMELGDTKGPAGLLGSVALPPRSGCVQRCGEGRSGDDPDRELGGSERSDGQ